MGISFHGFGYGKPKCVESAVPSKYSGTIHGTSKYLHQGKITRQNFFSPPFEGRSYDSDNDSPFLLARDVSSF